MASSHGPTDILIVKNDNFTFLLTSSGQGWQFHIATDIIVFIKNGNFTLLLTFIGQEWQFHIPTDILVVKNGYLTCCY